MGDRKAYFRWYNIHVRGRPEKAETFLRVKCLVCGNLAYPSAIKRTYATYVKLQRGYNSYFEVDDPALAGMQGFLHNDTKEKYSWMARKCAELLRRFVAMGLITEDEIKAILGLSGLRYIEKAGGVDGSGVVGSAVPVLSASVADRLNYLEDVEYG